MTQNVFVSPNPSYPRYNRNKPSSTHVFIPRPSSPTEPNKPRKKIINQPKTRHQKRTNKTNPKTTALPRKKGIKLHQEKDPSRNHSLASTPSNQHTQLRKKIGGIKQGQQILNNNNNSNSNPHPPNINSLLPFTKTHSPTFSQNHTQASSQKPYPNKTPSAAC